MKGIFKSKLIMGFILLVVGMSYINGQQITREKERIARESQVKIVSNINE